ATIRRGVLDEVGLFREGLRASEDYELWLRIASRGHLIACVREPLALYRQRPGSVTRNEEQLPRNLREVYRIAAEEYGLSGDLRALADEKLRRVDEHLELVPRSPLSW